jgi:hypothetical protein
MGNNNMRRRKKKIAEAKYQNLVGNIRKMKRGTKEMIMENRGN